MKIVALQCPSCGGSISIEYNKGKKACFCIHCGQQIILDDEVLRTEHKHVKVDQARITESENAAQIELERLRIYEKELENYEKRKKLYVKLGICWVVILFGVIGGVCLFYYESWESHSTLLIGLIVTFIWILVGIIGLCFFRAMNEKPNYPNSNKDHLDAGGLDSPFEL